MFEYRKACITDIEILTKTRVQVLLAANKLPESADMSIVRAETRDYCLQSLESGHHSAYLDDDGKFTGAGGVSFYRVMPTYSNPSSWKAYIMNMYTAPEYRRRGIAYQTLDLLVGEARNRGVRFIPLEAAGVGKPLYLKYGFRDMRDEMELPWEGHAPSI